MAQEYTVQAAVLPPHNAPAITAKSLSPPRPPGAPRVSQWLSALGVLSAVKGFVRPAHQSQESVELCTR
jgi:hypothetical protein